MSQLDYRVIKERYCSGNDTEKQMNASCWAQLTTEEFLLIDQERNVTLAAFFSFQNVKFSHMSFKATSEFLSQAFLWY